MKKDVHIVVLVQLISNGQQTSTSPLLFVFSYYIIIIYLFTSEKLVICQVNCQYITSKQVNAAKSDTASS